MEWLDPRESPLAAEVRRPTTRSRDVVLLLPRPPLGRPPLPAPVPAALDERQVAGIGDRRVAQQVVANVGAMGGMLVVVGESVGRCADCALASGNDHHLEA